LTGALGSTAICAGDVNPMVLMVKKRKEVNCLAAEASPTFRDRSAPVTKQKAGVA
jgi:hypothetical protein